MSNTSGRRPNVGGFDQTLAEFGRAWAWFNQSWVGLDQVFAPSGKFRPNSTQSWTKFGNTCSDIDQPCAEFGPNSLGLDDIGRGMNNWTGRVMARRSGTFAAFGGSAFGDPRSSRRTRGVLANVEFASCVQHVSSVTLWTCPRLPTLRRFVDDECWGER